MRNRRLTITGLAVIAALGLTACDPSDPGAAPAAGASTATAVPITADAAAELASAAAKLGTTKSAKVKILMGSREISANGVATGDGSRAAMRLFLGSATNLEQDPPTITLRKVGDDVWMKLGGPLGAALGARAGKWLHVDVAQLSSGSTVTTGNPADAAKMIKATAAVTKAGDNTFKGTIDMTKAPGLAQKRLAGIGADATAVPFTARTDLKGRLIQLTIDMEAVTPGAGKLETNYSDFGTPVAVQAPPAAQVIEMPQQLLSLVNG
jgi:hypothetical protein